MRPADYKGSSDLYIDANTQLALSAARRLRELTGKRVHILLPDETEYTRAAERWVAGSASSEDSLMSSCPYLAL
jgi:hypothetical protein